MQVLKFGGTSVGSAERMHALVKLVVNKEPKVVVLSAMSGTTNVLVEISEALYKKETTTANELINKLEEKYKSEIAKLYKTEEYKKKAGDLITHHFNYLRAFTLDMFTSNEEKAILAQGELSISPNSFRQI